MTDALAATMKIDPPATVPEKGNVRSATTGEIYRQGFAS
jgi:hypothetical protein